ncbi:peptidoglycan DD-metalloendopeptidase family protein [Pusillimonas sp. ANT_WB101]|nr:peptidoglycan DD-metalloendopeptidase family protein [Pusillimonas sp. ANT_WB101]
MPSCPTPQTHTSLVRRLASKHHALRWLLASAMLSLLVACGTTTTQPVASGQYRVVSGDTLSKIARQHGQSVQSLMKMNSISNPNRLEVGQVLRVQGSGVATSRPAPTPSSGVSVTPTPSASARSGAAGISLAWPAEGNVNRGLKGPSPYGLYIINKVGTPIKSVADGKVVYAGNGLRGYGNLVIVNHASSYLSVYAHNRSITVKEGQSVRQGQKIAEMGSSESKQVGLYFELRHNGKSVNANSYLPK